MRYLITVCMLFLVGCSAMPGMPGYISTSTSSYDGITQYDMEPGNVYRGNGPFNGADLFMSLSYNKKMGDDIVLIVHTSGLHRIAGGQSLQFMIDGEETVLSSGGSTNMRYEPGVYSTSYVPGRSYSSRKYIVQHSFIDLINNAEDVRVRLQTEDGGVSGIYSNDTASSAVVSFREFMDKIRKEK